MLFFPSRLDLQKRRNLKRFGRSKFDLSDYVNDHYIDDDGYAYISANVKSIYDIITPYSIKDYEWINANFAAFIEKNAYFIPIEERVTLEICGAEFTEAEQKLIRRVVLSHFNLKLGDVQLDLNDNKNKSIALILMGLLLFGIVSYLFRAQTLGNAIELATIVFWGMIWDGIELILFDRNELNSQKMDAAQLSNMRIIFNPNQK